MSRRSKSRTRQAADARTREFPREEGGLAVVEYALLLAMLSLGALAAYESLVEDTDGLFSSIEAKIEAKRAK